MKEIDIAFLVTVESICLLEGKEVIIVKISTVIKAIVKYIWDVEPFWFKCKIL